MIEKINFELNNIEINLLKTKKYKVASGIISFVKPVKKEDFTYYTLLNRLISSSCEKYPTKNLLSNKMYELYDCTAYMSTGYSYKTANTTFVFSTINNKYANNKTLLKDCIDLLKEMMLKPLLENDGFNIKYFNEEKKGLESDIKSIYNNKKRYSLSKLLSHIYPNDILSESTLGNLDVLKNITPKSLYDFYKELLNNSKIAIGIIGDVTKEEVESYFNDFELKTNNLELERFPKSIPFREKVQSFSETQDIVQSRLLIGFKHNINYKDENYFPLIVFDAMFGGIFGSSLFMNIREANSLAYDISSMLSMPKKLLTVTCGVAKKNIDLTIDLVIKELENYRNGKIDETLLENAKNYLLNDLKEVEDFPFSLLAYNMETKLSDRPSYEETIEGISKVEMEDIISVSKLLKIDTIFTLIPGDDDE